LDAGDAVLEREPEASVAIGAEAIDGVDGQAAVGVEALLKLALGVQHQRPAHGGEDRAAIREKNGVARRRGGEGAIAGERHGPAVALARPAMGTGIGEQLDAARGAPRGKRACEWPGRPMLLGHFGRPAVGREPEQGGVVARDVDLTVHLPERTEVRLGAPRGDPAIRAEEENPAAATEVDSVVGRDGGDEHAGGAFRGGDAADLVDGAEGAAGVGLKGDDLAVACRPHATLAVDDEGARGALVGHRNEPPRGAVELQHAEAVGDVDEAVGMLEHPPIHGRGAEFVGLPKVDEWRSGLAGRAGLEPRRGGQQRRKHEQRGRQGARKKRGRAEQTHGRGGWKGTGECARSRRERAQSSLSSWRGGRAWTKAPPRFAGENTKRKTWRHAAELAR